MKWCPCGERKAGQIMQQCELTNQNYIQIIVKKEKNKLNSKTN